MNSHTDLHEQNRLSWNAANAAHNGHKGDQTAFFRAGGDTLFNEEVELLVNLDGVGLLHLQCNAGQNTLFHARRGVRARGRVGVAGGGGARRAHHGRCLRVVRRRRMALRAGVVGRGIAGVLRPAGASS